jgi:hypothetical protein
MAAGFGRVGPEAAGLAVVGVWAAWRSALSINAALMAAEDLGGCQPVIPAGLLRHAWAFPPGAVGSAAAAGDVLLAATALELATLVYDSGEGATAPMIASRYGAIFATMMPRALMALAVGLLVGWRQFGPVCATVMALTPDQSGSRIAGQFATTVQSWFP